MTEKLNIQHLAAKRLNAALNGGNPIKLEDLQEVLWSGIDPDTLPQSPTSKAHLVTQINEGDVEAVAMLLTAGAKLDGPYHWTTPREIIAGNLRDALAFEKSHGSIPRFDRLQSAKAMAELATEEGLKAYQAKSVFCQKLLEASLIPVEERIAACYG